MSIVRISKIRFFVTIACLAGSAVAQERAVFDAASVKVSQADTSEVVQTDKGLRRPAYHPFRYAPGRVTCTLPLISIIAQAYGLKIWQISGPAWLYDGAYEIAATMPPDSTPEQIHDMLRSLLADRFEMKSHREMREIAVYELTQVTGRSRLTESQESDSPGFVNNATDIKATKVTMQRIADWLNNLVDRAVIDRTGLTGTYNIALKWTPEYVDSDVKATDFGLLRAMESELGLRLTATKNSQPVLIVDQARKIPRDN